MSEFWHYFFQRFAQPKCSFFFVAKFQALRTELIHISPSVLTWARETRGFTLSDVAERMKKDEALVKSWETGDSQPSFAQLERLAYEIYKRPLAIFFLPAPPVESPLTQDFRTLPEQDVNNLSPEFRLKVRRIKYYQTVLKEIFDGKNPLLNPLHKLFSFNKNTTPTQASTDVRRKLDVSYDKIKSLPNHTDAFKFYKSLIEDNGIFIFQESLKEASGFSLFDKEFPVICLNGTDVPQKKVFSIFHELAHILFNSGGVFRDSVSEKLLQNKDVIEIFCNRFAADFLVPSEYFQSESIVQSNRNGIYWDESDINRLSAIYKVSRETILRKLLALNMTTQDYYQEMKRKWDEQYIRMAKEKKEKQKGSPNWHTTHVSHLGKRFITSVFQGLADGKISELDAANFLGIKVNKLSEYALLTSPSSQDA